MKNETKHLLLLLLVACGRTFPAMSKLGKICQRFFLRDIGCTDRLR